MKYLLFTVILGLANWAQAWEPTRPVTAVIAYSPGSGNELLFRKAIALVNRNTTTSFVLEFRPGANEVVGTNHFATTAKPDGHSLFVPAIGVWIANPVWYQQTLVQDVMEFEPVISLGDTALALYTHTASPVLDPAGFAALLKSGQSVNIGTGAAVHALAYQFMAGTNSRAQRIQFTSPALVAQAVAAREVEFGITPLSMALEWSRSGRVRIVGVTAPARDYPLLSRQFPGLDLRGQVGIVAPKGTPAEIVSHYRRVFQTATAHEEYRDYLRELAWENTVTDYRAFIQEQRRRWMPVAQKLPFN